MEKGREKMQEICHLLRRETIEPAKQEALEIVENAQTEAEKIVETAKQRIEELNKEQEQKRAQKEKAFRASLSLAAKQALAELRQTLEEKLFRENLREEIEKVVGTKEVLVSCIEALLKIAQREEGGEDFSLVLPEKEKELLLREMARKGLAKWEEKMIFIEGTKGGVQLKLEKKRVTLDMSEEALFDLLSRYMRSDFKEFIFNSKNG